MASRAIAVATQNAFPLGKTAIFIKIAPLAFLSSKYNRPMRDSQIRNGKKSKFGTGTGPEQCKAQQLPFNKIAIFRYIAPIEKSSNNL